MTPTSAFNFLDFDAYIRLLVPEDEINDNEVILILPASSDSSDRR